LRAVLRIKALEPGFARRRKWKGDEELWQQYVTRPRPKDAPLRQTGIHLAENAAGPGSLGDQEGFPPRNVGWTTSVSSGPTRAFGSRERVTRKSPFYSNPHRNLGDET
jgi:hypothetical protein